MTALALRSIGQGDFTVALANALRSVTAGARSSAKLLAEAANSNVRTAENWLAARAIPNTYHWECLKEAFPELDDEIRRLRGLDVGDDVERQVSIFINTAVRRLAHEITARENRRADAKASRSSGDAPRLEGGEVASATRPMDTKR